MFPIYKDETPRSLLAAQAKHYRELIKRSDEEIVRKKRDLDRLERDKQWLEIAAVSFEREAEKIADEVPA